MSVTTLPTGVTTGTWVIETSHSSASFTVRHAGISKARGTVAITEGTLTIGDDLASSSVTATLDPATIDTKDANRDGHLKSADFFDAEQFPAMTFTSTGVEVVADDEIEVTGDLTIKDLTRQITIPLEYTGTVIDPFGNTRSGFEGSLPVKRSDFGLTWNAAIEAGGVLVSDKVTLEFDVSLVKQA